jgi:hypothetical protein
VHGLEAADRTVVGVDDEDCIDRPNHVGRALESRHRIGRRPVRCQRNVAPLHDLAGAFLVERPRCLDAFNGLEIRTKTIPVVVRQVLKCLERLFGRHSPDQLA